MYSSNIQRSLDYYQNILGFTESWKWGNPPTFAGISRDNVEIFFCLEGQGNTGTWQSIIVDDADEYYKTIKEKGAKIISPPESMEWNMREMLVEDPDGHLLRIGHRIECD